MAAMNVAALNSPSQPAVDNELDPWQMVAGWRPCLRSHVHIYCHLYRGHQWYVLDDGLGGNYFRFTPAVYSFLQQLDGEQSIADIYHRLQQHGDSAPDQQAVLQLLYQLDEAELLQGDVPVSGHSLEQRRGKKQQQRWQQRLLRPMAQRFPLHNPDPWLKKLQPVAAPLFSRAGFVIWLMLMLSALLQLGQHWPELALHYQQRFADPFNLLLLALLYPVVKGLHELGHAMATRHWGGAVHEVGIMLLVLMPLPYVDASSSHAFADKHRRIIVAAAGIMVELAIAAAGFYCWLWLPMGVGRDLAFNLIIIGGVSTLLFNGNPLLRFDGYYILADALEIPNLGQRSNQYLGYLFKRYALAIAAAPSPQTAPGEAPWLLLYGVLAGLYRVFISFAIALWVAGKYFIVGVILAVWMLLGQLLWPMLRSGKLLREYAVAHARGQRLYWLGAILALLAWLLLFALPITQSTVVEGVVNLSPQSQLRSQADGFVEQLLVSNGEPVIIGQPLLRLHNAELETELVFLTARSGELTARQHAVLVSDRTELDILRAEQRAIQAEIDDIQQQLQGLLLVSPADGTVAINRADDLQGQYIEKGDLLGHVVDQSEVEARVAIPQAQVDLVRLNSHAIEVKLHSQPGRILPARLLRQVPSATRELSSALLGSRSGGGIAVDAQDERGIKTMDSVFEFDLVLPDLTESHLGRRLKVRFIHDKATLAQQGWRKLRQLYLSQQAVIEY